QHPPPQDWSVPPSGPAGQPPAGPDVAGGAPVAGGTGPDVWAGDEVDEHTRIAGADQGDLGDLEHTRVSAVGLPPTRPVRITADDGTDRLVETAVVIGRNPTASEGDVLFVLTDETRSVSKTHLRIDGTGEDVTVTDLASTNGSAIVRADGTRENLVPNTATVLPAGATVAIGDRTVNVERPQ